MNGIMAELKGSLSNTGRRQALFGVAFAILVAPHSVLVLCFGLAGSSGNDLVIGPLLKIAIGAKETSWAPALARSAVVA